LVWASALTWTLLINVYVPVYDTLLVAVAVTLTIGALVHLGSIRAAGWVAILAITLSAVSFKAESIAQDHGIQPLTILLLILGLLQAFTLQSALRRVSSDLKAAPNPGREQPAMNQ
jgi:hypothetical protein